MRHLVLGTFFLSVVFLAQGFAGEIKVFELNDGSIITGEIISFNNGTFTLKTESLGTIRIEASKIRVIRSVETHGISEGTVQALQEKMIANEEVLTMILSLQYDPDFQAVFQDSDIMVAVGEGDIDALLSNPKFLKLLENPAIQDIAERIEE